MGPVSRLSSGYGRGDGRGAALVGLRSRQALQTFR